MVFPPPFFPKFDFTPRCASCEWVYLSPDSLIAASYGGMLRGIDHDNLTTIIPTSYHLYYHTGLHDKK